jgi:chromate transporter
MEAAPDSSPDPSARHDAFTIFTTFLSLGLTSFGGPIAHLAYFRQELVVRRRWMSEAAYGDLVALCQLLPGPTSSQVAFAIGTKQCGAAGALAAFAGFTAPSALLMLTAAAGLPLLTGELGAALMHALMLVAVSVVAQAVFGMARSFSRTFASAAIGLMVLVAMLMSSATWMQPAAIIGGGLLGLFAVPHKHPLPDSSVGRIGISVGMLSAFLLLLVSLPLAASMLGPGAVTVADVFYRSGAFVFGGGHVVLPLLEAETVGRGWLDEQTFLAGYGAAQALPGPLFTFAGYLGAVSASDIPPLIAGPLAIAMIFLPGFLLVAAALPIWRRLQNLRGASGFIGGANAAVVGLLAAALWDPVIRSAVMTPTDAVVATLGFALLTFLNAPPMTVIPMLIAASLVAHFLF